MSNKDQCFTHDPEVAERRQRSKVKGGKTGGRGRPKIRLDTIYSFAEAQLEGLFDCTVDPRRSAVAVQWCNLQIKAIETERKLIEHQELEEKVRALEKMYHQRRNQHSSDSPFDVGGWSY